MNFDQDIKYFDTHCHLDFDAFQHQQAQEVNDAAEVGVKLICVPSIAKNNWQKVLDLSDKFSGVYCSFGMHPYFNDMHKSSDLEDLASQITKLQARTADHSSKCVAIGECGLDFQHHSEMLTPSLIQKQYTLFEGQVDLAKFFGLPLIIHSHKSHNEVLKILRRKKVNQGVIHGFSGSFQEAMAFIDLGFHIGVGGVITYERAQKTRSTVSRLPLDALVLETDAPDMPISGYQGQTNHSYHIPKIFDALYHLVTQYDEMEEVQLQQKLLENSKRLFQLV